MLLLKLIKFFKGSAWIIVFTAALWSQHAWQIFNLPFSALSLGRSGGAAILPGEEISPNPAALEADKTAFGLTSLIYPENIQGYQLYCAHPIKTGIFGAGICILDYGELTDFQSQNSFSARDAWLRVAYKQTVPGLFSWGVSLGSGYSKIENYTASSLQVNLGVKTRLFNKRLGLGYSVENLGKTTEPYLSKEEPLPAAQRFGVYYYPQHLPALISIDYKQYRNQDSQLLGLIEFSLQNGIRFGISLDDNTDKLGEGEWNERLLTGMGFGFGWTWHSLTTDIGIRHLGSVGQVWGFSLIWQ